MDYKMYSPTGSIPANKNVVTLIKESLKKDGLTLNSPLRFVGFEATAGTQFYLNGVTNSNLMEVPSCGKFITPFDGERGVPVYSLIFKNSFSGNIYYIL